jgi:chromosome segregation ATPase
MELIGMEGPPPQRTFRSRVSALARSFRMSRDGWKEKYRAVKESLRSCRSELRDVRRSREKWRSQVEALKAENRTLRDQLNREPSDRSAEPSPPAPRMAALLVKAR